VAVPALAIINPVAAGGRAGRRWPLLLPAVAERFPGLVVRATEAAGHGEEIGREWARTEPAGPVVVVGGDGSIHEVVNGLVAAGWRGSLGVIPAGTGNDFVRSAGLPLQVDEAVARIGRGGPKPVDLGRIRFTDRAATARERLFLNSVSVGVSPRANRLAHSVKAFLPGRFSYAVSGVLALFREGRGGSYTITHDGAVVLSSEALDITVANGASYGGGMLISPGSKLDDGVLDQVVIGPIGIPRALLALSRVYQGSHVKMRGVTVTPVRGTMRLTRKGGPTLIVADGHDFDGEGELTIDVLPGALTLFS
jgi:YegS/Rv2252/BmrU family lipid kinase